MFEQEFDVNQAWRQIKEAALEVEGARAVFENVKETLKEAKQDLELKMSRLQALINRHAELEAQPKLRAEK